MVYVHGKATVEDFGEWRQHFATNDPYRADHGQTGYQAFQSLDDPNEVLILFEFETREQAVELFESEEFRNRMRMAGVKGAPDLTFYERFDRKTSVPAK